MHHCEDFIIVLYKFGVNCFLCFYIYVVTSDLCPVWITEINDRWDPLPWPRDTLYSQKLALLRQQAAVARSA
jgi:hypothetical protein